MENLLEMLRYRRPHKSRTEGKFINRFIRPLGMQTDDVGNLYKIVGDEKPTVMFSAHTDSVHKNEGKQKINVDLELYYVTLSKEEKWSNCLGADDAAGCWLLTEMIAAGVPGLYIFHRGEECGGIGSTYIAKNRQDLLSGIQAAIAFDRKGDSSVITHQSWSRCCSEAFGESLAAILSMGHKNDDGGTFTDTANYTHLIPECTNVSVGYYEEHSSKECLDIEYLWRLRNALIKADWSKLIIERDPRDNDDDRWWRSNYSYGGGSRRYNRRYELVLDQDYSDDEVLGSMTPVVARTLQDIVEDHPAHVADYLESVLGVSKEDLEDYIYQVEYGSYWDSKNGKQLKAM